MKPLVTCEQRRRPEPIAQGEHPLANPLGAIGCKGQWQHPVDDTIREEEPPILERPGGDHRVTRLPTVHLGLRQRHPEGQDVGQPV
ncbi:MAG: hypothetical protein WEA76_10615 [Acidimicrobiia bacterium]